MSTDANCIYREVLVIGMGTFPIAVYDAFTAYGIQPSLIEYGPESDVFRHLCAKKHIVYKNLSRDELTNLLDSIEGAALIVSAINRYIFPNRILTKPNITVINYHNSILPYHRGSHAEAFSIFDMDEYAGVTWHYVSEGIDEGDIITIHKLKINHDDTSISLLSRQNKEALEVFKKLLPNLLSNKMSGAKQAASTGELHLLKDIPANGSLNLEWSIDKIYAFLRSFDYGGLEVITRPQLTHKKKRYVWSSYALVPKKSKNDQIIFNIPGRNIEIHKAGSAHYINLQGVDCL
jgi:methionyl-tRNA formyltransferase